MAPVKRMRITDVQALEQQLLRETDMRRIDAMTDEDIERQVAENPDAARILTGAESAAAMVRGTGAAANLPGRIR